MRNLIKYFVLISLAFFPSFIVAEISLAFLPPSSRFHRVGKTWLNQYSFDSKTGYSLVKNIDDEILKIKTDKYGNRIVANEYDPSKKSLAIIGDSTVFGYGVKDEDSFVYLISKDKRFSCFNIINLGVPSYSLGNIKEVVDKKLAFYQPSMAMVAVLWPWKAFEDIFYGPNPRNDWKEVNIEFFREKIPIRDSYSRKYRFGDNVGYFLFKSAHDFKRKLKSLTEQYFANKKLSISNIVTRPGISDFDISKEEEIQYANDHLIELKKSERNFLLKNSDLETNFVYYLHPYFYTIDDPKYSKLGIIGYEFLQKELDAIDFKKIIRENYLKENNIKDLYFDGSHLSVKGNKIWAEILGAKISEELKRNNLVCRQ